MNNLKTISQKAATDLSDNIELTGWQACYTGDELQQRMVSPNQECNAPRDEYPVPTPAPKPAPIPCTVPVPDTQTKDVACPPGISGKIVQTSTASCPVGATSPVWSDWTTTSNTCETPKPTPAPCTLPTPSTETRSQDCPSGQTGSITQTRTASCPVGATSPVWSDWTTTSSNCQTASSTGPTIEMVSLPGGTFTMGSPTTETGQVTDETQHTVTVGAFKMGKYEVTQGQWQAVMGNNPSYFSSCGDDCPVENVSWLDIQDYIAALNAQTGQNYRLPTEAEWEYACRAGSTNPYLTYCGSNDVGAVAWYYDNSGYETHPVGGKAANAFGLYDMSGNVLEWTCSNYADPWNGSELQCDNNANYFALRSVRGGSWFNYAYSVRSALRYRYGPATRDFDLGFRLAQD